MRRRLRTRLARLLYRASVRVDVSDWVLVPRGVYNDLRGAWRHYAELKSMGVGGWQEISGVWQIATERARQISHEGYTPKHDDEHAQGELARAAACYAQCAGTGGPANWRDAEGAFYTPMIWPFQDHEWKPTPDPIRDLVKAGALIAAEIDRLERAR